MTHSTHGGRRGAGALIQDSLGRLGQALRENAMATWSDDPPARAWEPRPDRLYRRIHMAFGRRR